MSFICVPFSPQPLDFWSDYPRLAALPTLPDVGQFCSGSVCLDSWIVCIGIVMKLFDVFWGWLADWDWLPTMSCRILNLECWSYVHAESNMPIKENTCSDSIGTITDRTDLAWVFWNKLQQAPSWLESFGNSFWTRLLLFKLPDGCQS